MVVAEFLRHLGVEFTDDELTVSATDDDVDVHFRTARFQNAERVDRDRRRHTEYRQFSERVATARDVTALEVPFPNSTPMPVEELLKEVATALEKKSRKTVNRAALDALVYMNLRGWHLYPVPAGIVDSGAIAELGWRSVSVLSPPFGAVVFAAPSAPAFLRERVGRFSQVAGIPWEGGSQPPRSGMVGGLAGKVVAGSAVAGYVVLGGIVLLARTVSETVATVGSRLLGAGRVVEAQSAMTGMWRTVTPRLSLQEATRGLGCLSQRYVGVRVFEEHHWRLHEVTTAETVPGELLGG